MIYKSKEELFELEHPSKQLNIDSSMNIRFSHSGAWLSRIKAEVYTPVQIGQLSLPSNQQKVDCYKIGLGSVVSQICNESKSERLDHMWRID